ncbi:hypothetical protein D3C85_1806380 [compost metagenome]
MSGARRADGQLQRIHAAGKVSHLEEPVVSDVVRAIGRRAVNERILIAHCDKTGQQSMQAREFLGLGTKNLRQGP